MVNATLELSDTIRVADIQPGGGVVLEHDHAIGVSVGWERLLAGPGTSVTVTGHGLVNGRDQEAGSVVLFQDDDSVRLVDDLTALATDSWRVEAYDRGRLVGAAHGHGSVASLKTSIWPMAAGLARAPGGEASLVASFEHATQLQGDGIDIMADEIRIIAESGLAIEHIDRVQLGADEVAEITITGVDTTPR